MEVLGIIGIIVLCFFLFVGGGLLGWIFKGLGAIFDFLMQRLVVVLGSHRLDLYNLFTFLRTRMI